MPTKVRCTTCGALILPVTAAETGGRCMPCVKGRRLSPKAEIDLLEWEARSASLHTRWLDLLTRRGERGWEALGPVEQAFYAMLQAYRDILRGGFSTYFNLVRAAEHESAKRAYRDFGAPASADALEGAERVIFPAGIPRDAAEQDAAMVAWEFPYLENETLADPLAAATANFYASVPEAEAAIDRCMRAC